MSDVLSDGVPALPEYADAVLEIVDQIPRGRVLAYGDIAEVLGRGGPRGVGSVMAHFGSMTRWWRVVRADGRPAAGHAEQAREHYREESTPMVRGRLAGIRVDMAAARWADPPDAPLADIAPKQGRR